MHHPINYQKLIALWHSVPSHTISTFNVTPVRTKHLVLDLVHLGYTKGLIATTSFCPEMFYLHLYCWDLLTGCDAQNLCFGSLVGRVLTLLFHNCYVSIFSFLSAYIYGMQCTLLLFLFPVSRQSYEIVKLDQYGRERQTAMRKPKWLWPRV